jgi:AbrB family looped-hinge helix DNA binding protein
MQATIDGAGRIVVPKALREAMGVKPGQELELELHDGRLEIAIAPTPMRLERRRGRIVAVPAVELPLLTADQVRVTLEQTRR